MKLSKIFEKVKREDPKYVGVKPLLRRDIFKAQIAVTKLEKIISEIQKNKENS